MRLYEKTVVIVGITVLVLIAALYTTMQMVLGRGLVQLEEKYTLKSVEQAVNALENRLHELDTKLVDWAYWDDTYEFVQTLSSSYKKANLQDSTYTMLKINLMIFVDAKGEILHARYIDLETQQEMSFPAELTERIHSGRLSLLSDDPESQFRGILRLREGALMLAGRHVLTSNGDGPSVGMLFMGRFLDAAEVEHFCELTRLNVEMFEAGSPELPEDVMSVSGLLTPGARAAVRVLDKNKVAGYHRVDDADGNPGVIIKVSETRDIYYSGRSSVWFVIWALVIGGVVMGVIMVFLLRWLVISRVAFLSAKVSHVRTSGDLSQRVEMAGEDEISALADEVDGMLQSLEETQTQLRHAKDEAETANRTKTEFFAKVSHEIRTPLNAIIGMTELLVQTPLSPVQKEMADSVDSAGRILLNTINDILDISKIEAGKLVLSCVPMDVREVVRSTANLMKARALEKKVDLKTVIPEALPKVMGDSARLGQVLLNLVSNALKFTHEGQVVIRVFVLEQDDKLVHTRFEVEDTGIGITEENMKKLFNPFVQVDGSNTRKYGGTGLGLAICKQLVGLMHGTIGVKSTEGKGSVFWFVVPFPCCTGEQLRDYVPDGLPASVREAAATLSSQPMDPILVVEDHPVNRNLASMQLTKLGYPAEFAVHGREAVEKYRQGKYTVILMDCQMPEMDGFEATREIRKLERETGVHIPIIAMTANSMEADRERCIMSGMDDFVSKPVRLDKLSEVLNKWMV